MGPRMREDKRGGSWGDGSSEGGFVAMVGWHWGWVPAPRLRGGKLST